MRAGLVLGGLVALLLVTNLLSLVGYFVYFVFPVRWLAGEFGVILVAVAAIIAASGVTGRGAMTDRV